MPTPEYHAGYYSLIQYCPDYSRMESVNVGVVLLVPGVRFIKARMAKGARRPVRFFGRESVDARWLEVAKSSLQAHLGAASGEIVTVVDLARFAAKMANELLLTFPRPVKVRKPETELNRLFEELVL